MGYYEELRKLKKKQKYERERSQLLKKISDQTDYLHWKIKQMWENNPVYLKEKRRMELFSHARDTNGNITYDLPFENELTTEEEKTRVELKEKRRKQLFNKHRGQ